MSLATSGKISGAESDTETAGCHKEAYRGIPGHYQWIPGHHRDILCRLEGRMFKTADNDQSTFAYRKFRP
jgi:hypothetical protein